MFGSNSKGGNIVINEIISCEHHTAACKTQKGFVYECRHPHWPANQPFTLEPPPFTQCGGDPGKCIIYKQQTQIHSLYQLKLAAAAGAAVVVPSSRVWAMPKPASFIFNLQTWIVHRLLSDGLFVYVPKSGPRLSASSIAMRAKKRKERLQR